MEDAEEVEAYSGAAAERHLARLDGGAARRAARLAEGARLGVDLGCGPGSIPLLVAARCPGLRMIGVDLSLPMLRQARCQMRRRQMNGRLLLVLASASALPFRSGVFDLVSSNSLLHHLADPDAAMREAERVAAPGAAVFIRDLRRPAAPLLGAHLAFCGRHYRGTMRRLFEVSVRAAYAACEARGLAAAIPGVHVRRRGWAHLEMLRRRRAPGAGEFKGSRG
jgi:ubiquinone/menaquinone biosynthesis C-methylase UbiE